MCDLSGILICLQFKIYCSEIVFFTNISLIILIFVFYITRMKIAVHLRFLFCLGLHFEAYNMKNLQVSYRSWKILIFLLKNFNVFFPSFQKYEWIIIYRIRKYAHPFIIMHAVFWSFFLFINQDTQYFLLKMIYRLLRISL